MSFSGPGFVRAAFVGLCGALAALPGASCAADEGATATPPIHPAADGSVDAIHDTKASDSADSEGPTGCIPATCVKLGATCGGAPDGCGGAVSCGACPAGETCGGAGPNQCGSGPCTAKTCNQLGASCGAISDGCSAVLQCGTCSTGSCINNACGCTPTSCSALSLQCGSASDGCGGTLSCGQCPGNQACSSGSCGCSGGQHLCGDDCVADGTCCTDGDCTGLTVCSSPGTACACRTSPARLATYRSVHGQDHLLSTNPTEGEPYGYVSEGIVFYIYATPCQWGLVPLHRVRNTTTNEHLCTANDLERDTLVAAGWAEENDIGCIASAPTCGSVEIYRLQKSWHILTVDSAERDALMAAGWTLESTAGYAWNSP
ncbi:MAG: hypothetical protein HY898_16665 [Deltaproteobacteria bacterium]|nr:hypothetical protein [Deltaproteobacteria bacterium]